MNGGLIDFVEATDKLGITLQVIHNIAPNPGDDHRNVVFAYYNDVEEVKVGIVYLMLSSPFLSLLLSPSSICCRLYPSFLRLRDYPCCYF